MDTLRTIARLLFFGWIWTTVSCQQKKPLFVPTPPDQALSTFTIADGFTLELVAAEPLVKSPVDMEIDEWGRMYVVEMPGYPLDVAGSGKIILLSDSDGDGTMDKRTVFMEGLILPTGIQRWKNGFIITDSPHVLYLEDTDDDGKADKIDTLLTGFARTNPQHNMNNPMYGLDNWIYVANEGAVPTRNFAEAFGGKGEEIRFPGFENSLTLPVNAEGRSYRFKPENKGLEMMSTRCQFGHTFDEWGNWFGCNNSHQGYQEIIANRYFARNPFLLASESTHSMSDHKDAAEVFPITHNPDRQLLTDVGTMTAASGLTAYLGNAFPAPYDGKLTFIAESVSNIVHVDALRDSGVSYVASRITENAEFLASTDSYHRPVNLYVGPDGALYMLDYYRRVIESPEWMSDEAIAEGNLYDGVDMGRIYRISPVDGKKADWMQGLQLGGADIQTLIKELSNPNGWWRLHAQRLLVDKADPQSVPYLQELAQNASSAIGRLHALWTLEGIGALSADHIIQALKDTVAGIRTNAIKLAELHLKESPALEQQLYRMEKDKDPKVRLQLLLTLGFSTSHRATQIRNTILFEDIKDKWIQIAALSAPVEQTAALLNLVLNRYNAEEPAYASLVSRLTEMAGASAETSDLLALIKKSCIQQPAKPWQASMLSGLSKGIRKRKPALDTPEDITVLLNETFFNTTDDKLRSAALSAIKATGFNNETLKQESIKKAIAISKDKSETDARRADAIAYIALDNPQPYFDLLTGYMVVNEKYNVQTAALHTLNAIPNSLALCKYLVAEWPTLSNAVRNDGIPVFMASEEKLALLIDAIEKKQIPTSDISFWRSVMIMQTPDERLRKRARKAFTKEKESAKEINKKYQKSLELTGDKEKGLQVFLQSCAICHQVRGEMGVAIGPDMGTVRNWKKEDLLANILDPNLAIFPGFDLWDITLNTGESIQGIIANESSSAITLKNQGMVDRTINRQDIESMRSLNLSAMPSGLEEKIDYQQMADLIAFLREN